MASPPVNFDDLFDDSDDVLQQAGSIFTTANAPPATTPALKHLPVQRVSPTAAFLSANLFTLLVASLAVTVVFWGYSLWSDARRRQREEFYQLEHRRRHGIPDDDKRPWNEAYPAALERRRPKPSLRPGPNPSAASIASSSSSYDPYGRSIRDQLITEQNARIERANFEKQFAAQNPSSQETAYPGPLTLNRVRSSAMQEAQGRSVSPVKRPASPQRGASSQPSRQGGLLANGHTNGHLKTNGRKRLFMDPREEEDTHGQSGAETSDDQTTFSLPKRQRVNTWGAESQHAVVFTQRAEKRAADDDESANVKRKRSAVKHEDQPKVSANPVTPRGPNAVPIGRLKVLKGGRPSVTFAPTPPELSGPGSAPAPPPAETRGQKRDHDDIESVVDGGDEPTPRAAATNGQRARKRGRGDTVTPSPEKKAKTKSKAAPPSDAGDLDVDPLCAGHKVGEIWESGNMKFKVGPDGHRLRAGLIKERRPKYHMPSDSIHRDHTAMIEVTVEKWYNDEDYAAAKAAGDFAWQEEPVPSSPSKLNSARSSSSFWDAPSSSAFISTDGEVNPFARESPGRFGPTRTRVSLGSPAAVPKGGRRTASTRWQKQQAEAEALKRIHEAKRAQEEAAAKAKAAASPAPPASSSLAPTTTVSAFPAAPALSLPSLGQDKSKLGAPSDKSGDQGKPNLFAGFGKTEPPKPVPSLFSPLAPSAPAGAAAAPKPSTLAPPVTSSSAAKPLFSLAPPASSPAAAPAASPFALAPPATTPSALNPSAPSPAAPGSSMFTFLPVPKPAGSSNPSAPAPTPTPTSAFPTFPSSASASNPFAAAPKAPAASSPAPSTTGAPQAGAELVLVPGQAPGSVGPSLFGASGLLETKGGSLMGRTDSSSSSFGTPTVVADSQSSNGSNATLVAKPSGINGSSSAAGGPNSFFGAAPAASSPAPSPFGTANSGAPSMFGAKPDAPGLSLKGAASAFPAANGSTNLFAFGATTNGNGAASAAGSMNKKWTNPDLAKKDDATNGAPAPATNGTPANIFGTGASTPTGIFGGASTAFGQPANGAAAKPNPFQTGPVEPSPSTPKSTFGAPAFGQPGGLFGGGANGATSSNSSAAGAAPTPTAWVPPAADNPFSPTSSMFGGRGPPGVVAAGARSRSRSSRPPTRPPR